MPDELPDRYQEPTLEELRPSDPELMAEVEALLRPGESQEADPSSDVTDEINGADGVGDENDPIAAPSGDDVQAVPDGAASAEPPLTADGELVTFAGRQMTREEEVAAGQLLDWMGSLDEQAMGRVLRAAVDLETQNLGQQVAPPTAPAEPAAPEDPYAQFRELADPELMAVIDGQQAQINQLMSAFGQQQAQTEAQQQAQAQAAWLDVTGTLGEKYQLTDVEAQALINATLGNNTIEFYAGQSSDPAQFYAQALDATVWQTPQFRDIVVGRQLEAVAREGAADTSARERRKQLASSVTPTSGSQPSANAVDPRTLTKDQREAAMLAEIEQIMASNS